MSNNFAITGVTGYVAPRHLKAIRDTGNRLVAATDPHDSVGILGQYSFDVRFFTNVINPRSQIIRHDRYQRTLVRRGATIGANATIICGVTIGLYAFIGAGAVVRGDVPDYALMLGVPAVQKGWMGRHGHRLPPPNADGTMICPESGWRYSEIEPNQVRCLDWPERQPLSLSA